MYGVLTYIRPKNLPNTGKYTIHWIYPVAVPNEALGWDPYSKKNNIGGDYC